MESPPPSSLTQSQVTLRTMATVCFSILATTALAFFLVRARVAITLTLAAAMMAVALNHTVVALSRHGLSRRWAMGLVVAALLGLTAGMVSLLVPAVVSQAQALIAQAPSLWQRISHTQVMQALGARDGVQEELGRSVSAASGAVSPLFNALTGVVDVVGGGLTLLFLAIFMLIFGADVVQSVLELCPDQQRQRYQRIIEKIYASVGGYLGGLLGICTVNATLTTTFLAIIRMPFFLPLGILSGASSLIPYAGPVVMAAVTTVLVLITEGPWKALATLIYYFLYGQLEGNVLGPLVYRHTVHVNPLITLLSILFLADFMGAAGAVIAVPVAAAIQIIVHEFVLLRKDPAREPPPAYESVRLRPPQHA